MATADDIPLTTSVRLQWSDAHLLGEGSFGRVYRGIYNGTPVAIKVIRRPDSKASFSEEQRLQEAAARKQHRREIHRLRQVSHPYVIQCLGVFRDEDPRDLYIVTEFLEGGSLNDSLVRMRARGAILHDKSFLQVALHIAYGLNHVHLEHFTHGDMKPQNVLLTSAFQFHPYAGAIIATLEESVKVKIADFGLSKRLEGAQQSTAFISATATSDFGPGPCGTFLYMSPEAYRGVASLTDSEAMAADVYAYGLILFELLSGLQSWQLERVTNPYQLNSLVMERRRPSWGPRREQIQPAYVDLVERCWQHEPAERPTAQEIVETLHALQEDYARRLTEQEQHNAVALPAEVVGHPDVAYVHDQHDQPYDTPPALSPPSEQSGDNQPQIPHRMPSPPPVPPEEYPHPPHSPTAPHLHEHPHDTSKPEASSAAPPPPSGPARHSVPFAAADQSDGNNHFPDRETGKLPPAWLSQSLPKHGVPSAKAEHSVQSTPCSSDVESVHSIATEPERADDDDDDLFRPVQSMRPLTDSQAEVIIPELQRMSAGSGGDAIKVPRRPAYALDSGSDYSDEFEGDIDSDDETTAPVQPMHRVTSDGGSAKADTDQGFGIPDSIHVKSEEVQSDLEQVARIRRAFEAESKSQELDGNIIGNVAVARVESERILAPKIDQLEMPVGEGLPNLGMGSFVNDKRVERRSNTSMLNSMVGKFGQVDELKPPERLQMQSSEHAQRPPPPPGMELQLPIPDAGQKLPLEPPMLMIPPLGEEGAVSLALPTNAPPANGMATNGPPANPPSLPAAGSGPTDPPSQASEPSNAAAAVEHVPPVRPPPLELNAPRPHTGDGEATHPPLSAMPARPPAQEVGRVSPPKPRPEPAGLRYGAPAPPVEQGPTEMYHHAPGAHTYAKPPIHPTSQPMHGPSPPMHPISQPMHSASPPMHPVSQPHHAASPPLHALSPPMHAASPSMQASPQRLSYMTGGMPPHPMSRPIDHGGHQTLANEPYPPLVLGGYGAGGGGEYHGENPAASGGIPPGAHMYAPHRRKHNYSVPEQDIDATLFADEWESELQELERSRIAMAQAAMSGQWQPQQSQAQQQHRPHAQQQHPQLQHQQQQHPQLQHQQQLHHHHQQQQHPQQPQMRPGIPMSMGMSSAGRTSIGTGGMPPMGAPPRPGMSCVPQGGPAAGVSTMGVAGSGGFLSGAMRPTVGNAGMGMPMGSYVGYGGGGPYDMRPAQPSIYPSSTPMITPREMYAPVGMNPMVMTSTTHHEWNAGARTPWGGLANEPHEPRSLPLIGFPGSGAGRVDSHAVMAALQRPDRSQKLFEMWREGHHKTVASCLAVNRSVTGDEVLNICCDLLSTNNALPRGQWDVSVTRDLCTAIGNVARAMECPVSQEAAARAVPQTLRSMSCFENPNVNQQWTVFVQCNYALSNLFRVNNVIADDELRTSIARWIVHTILWNTTGGGGKSGRPPLTDLAYMGASCARNFMWMNESNVAAFVTACGGKSPTEASPLVKPISYFEWTKQLSVVESSLSAVAMIIHFPAFRVEFARRHGMEWLCKTVRQHCTHHKLCVLALSMLTVMFSRSEGVIDEKGTIGERFVSCRGATEVMHALREVCGVADGVSSGRTAMNGGAGAMDESKHELQVLEGMEGVFRTLVQAMRYNDAVRRSVMEAHMSSQTLACVKLVTGLAKRRRARGTASCSNEIEHMSGVVGSLLCEAICEMARDEPAVEQLRQAGATGGVSGLRDALSNCVRVVKSCDVTLRVLT